MPEADLGAFTGKVEIPELKRTERHFRFISLRHVVWVVHSISACGVSSVSNLRGAEVEGTTLTLEPGDYSRQARSKYEMRCE